MALNSPKKSLLFRLFNEKTKLKNDLHRNEKTFLKIENCFVGHSIEYLKLIRKNLIVITTQIEGSKKKFNFLIILIIYFFSCCFVHGFFNRKFGKKNFRIEQRYSGNK